MTKKFAVTAKVWIYPGMVGWHFVTIPVEITKDIDFYFSQSKKGWGSLPVQVSLGKIDWKTSIFPDKKSASYLLPLKAEVRKKEHLQEGDTISFSLEIKG
jgi:hypothetical protein